MATWHYASIEKLRIRLGVEFSQVFYPEFQSSWPFKLFCSSQSSVKFAFT